MSRKNILPVNTIFSRILSVGEVQRQGIISFVNQISFTFFGFLSTMYFAHTLGASTLGAYYLFTVYYGIINLITDGGFGGAAIKRISEGEEQDSYFSAFFVIRSSFVFGVILILVIFREYFSSVIGDNVLIWLLIALIASLFYGSVSGGVAGRGKMGVYSICNFINNFSRVLLQVVLVFIGYEVVGLFGGFVGGLFIATLVELYFFDLHLKKFEWKHIKSLSAFSFWLFLTSGGVLLYSYTDTLMIGYYLSNEDVGIYRVVYQFTTMAVLATTALRAVLWPKVSHWGKTGELKLVELSLSRAFSYSLIFALPILTGGLILGEQLLYYFYGAEFARGYLTLLILLMVQVVNVFQFFLTTYLGALDRQKESFKVTAIACTVNIALNLILIPLMGIIGAAIATLVTMSINAILARRILSKIINIRVENDSLKNIFMASISMGFFVGCYRFFIPLSNLLLTLLPVFLGGLFYGILLLKFDARIRDELKGILIKLN